MKLFDPVSFLIGLIDAKSKELEDSFRRKHIELMQRYAASQSGELSAEEAAEKEKLLLQDPFNMQARCLLLGFYDQFEPGEQQERYVEHALWMIENKPRSMVVRDCEFYGIEDGGIAYQRGKEVWLRHVQNHPGDTTILSHAASYFLLQDAPLSEKLLLQCKMLEPRNHEWPAKLAHLYALGIDGIEQQVLAESALRERKAAYYLCGWASKDQLNELEELPALAFKAGQMKSAQIYAKRLLRRSKRADSSSKSDCKHKAYTTLGRIALMNGDIERAKEHLLRSAEVEGSPVLGSFGPHMSLAKELLSLNEKEIVLSFLDRCQRFWKSRREEIPSWRSDIECDRVPKGWHKE